MKKEFEASLEDAIQKWIDKNCDDLSDLYDFYFHPGLVEQMAQAATMVLDSSVEGQEYAKQESQ